MSWLNEMREIEDGLRSEANYLRRLATAFGTTGNAAMEDKLLVSYQNLCHLAGDLQITVSEKLNNDLAEAKSAFFGGMKSALEVSDEAKKMSSQEVE